jgi:hypothetical protein
MRVQGVDIVDVELVGDVGVALGGCEIFFGFGVFFGEDVGELYRLGFECVEVVEDGVALLEDRLAAHGEAVLRQITEGHPFHAGERAVIERFDAGDDLEQGGFARAVAADQAGALVWRDEPIGVFEEEFLAEPLAGA